VRKEEKRKDSQGKSAMWRRAVLENLVMGGKDDGQGEGGAIRLWLREFLWVNWRELQAGRSGGLGDLRRSE